MEASAAELIETLRRFGHDSFRPGQERIIRWLLSGRDVLAVLPTGSGKSLVYQLAAQLLPGPTVVVSPLIALMKDQVDVMERTGLGAAMINSTLSAGERAEEFERVAAGAVKVLYLTPERFNDEEFVDQLETLDVSLFVVDEAHCISEWGHDFRPAYLNLSGAVNDLGRPTVLAMTATATPWVRDDIVERLDLRDPGLFVLGTDRPNLFLEVLRVEREEEDFGLLSRLLEPAAPAARYPEEVQ
jgi:ATP-dependent DNA helicase RecQ